MNLAQRFPFAALAAPLASDIRDRLASRLLGTHTGCTIEMATTYVAWLIGRAQRRRPV
jgi:hypothetical protein